MRYRALTSLAIMLCCVSWVSAKEIYTWKSDTGTHYTDNLAEVPEEYREKGKRDLATDEPTLDNEILVNLRKDEMIWKAKCAMCHHTGEGKIEGKRGLVDFTLIYPDKTKRTVEQMLPELRMVIQGRTSEMPKHDISDEELLSIARFLLR